MSNYYQIAIDTPAHIALGSVLTWECAQDLPSGRLVRVPLGQREVLGVVLEPLKDTPANADQIKPIAQVLEAMPALTQAWLKLLDFSARYYQRSLGEVLLAALPTALKTMRTAQLAKSVAKLDKSLSAERAKPAAAHMAVLPTLQPQQAAALTAFVQTSKPCLLWGATGSGKTEVYLRLVEQALAESDSSQVLLLVPEINLTPQLEARVRERFVQHLCVSLHSGLTPAKRLAHWLAAHTGSARVVLGTRNAVFASLPHLRLIVVDEEHDPSYKSQDGARYSARDLAIYRAQQEGARVLLASATPSLETWHACQRGRYVRLDMPHSAAQTMPATDASTPAPPSARLRLVDMRLQPKTVARSHLPPALLAAMQERLAAGQQCLVFLNRRGYAPALSCAACSWKSACPHCSAYRVFHKLDRSLRCHHCGVVQPVPRACPECGNPDIGMVGRGTERIAEDLIALLPEGTRVLRIDADSTKAVGSLQQQLAQVHAGEVDVLIGTQMVTKGHDFRRIGLVAALGVDAALFSSDYRAAERLFALLLQAAGRAGRDAQTHAFGAPEIWIPTESPDHPLFAALRTHNFAGFAQSLLDEREAAGLPPFVFQTLLRSEAKTADIALDFLHSASAAASTCKAAGEVTVYPAVPQSMARVANVDRAQMLVESHSRKSLHTFLSDWQRQLRDIRPKGLIRWALDVDPLSL